MTPILDFNKAKETKENRTEEAAQTEVTLNVLGKIKKMKEKTEAYGKEEMVDVADWDGGCWRAVFEKVCTTYAEQFDVDPWDVLVVFMHEFFDLMEGE